MFFKEVVAHVMIGVWIGIPVAVCLTLYYPANELDHVWASSVISGGVAGGVFGVIRAREK